MFDAPLWVVTVPVRSPMAVVDNDSVEARLVASTAARVGGQGIVLTAGSPGEVIADDASRDGSLVVMATHGRTPLRRLAMGSTAMAVVRRSTAPVVVVREESP
jgi:nucleotide-binding universal stress UspA family protein